MSRNSAHDDDVLVIGLGRFGASAALELRRLGHKVTAIEKDGFLAEKFLGRLSHVIHGDASDVGVIRDAKAGRFRIAVVAIGSSVEASVLACANLVDAGIPTDGKSRLEFMEAEDPPFARDLRQHLTAGGRFPEWTEEDLSSLVPDATSASLRVEIVRVEHLGSHDLAWATLEAHAVTDAGGTIMFDPAPVTTIRFPASCIAPPSIPSHRDRCVRFLRTASRRILTRRQMWFAWRRRSLAGITPTRARGSGRSPSCRRPRSGRRC